MSAFTFRPMPACRRPRDLVTIRDWLATQWSPGGDFYAASVSGVFGNTGDTIEYADTEARGIERASLFWLTEEMCLLLNAVAKSMPGEVELNEALLVDRLHTAGLVWFETPMIGLDAHSGKDIRIDAMMWGPIQYPLTKDKAVPGIGLSWYQLDPNIGVLLPLGRSDWLMGHRIDDASVVELGIAAGAIQPEWRDAYLIAAIEDRRALASVLALSTQNNVSEVEHDNLDRPTRRRRERENLPPSSVNIVRLRNPKEHGEPSDEKTDRHYSHRWIVDAHFRNQAYGPNRSLRKPILIASHVKGPKDAPLIVKDKVHVL